MAFPTAYEIMRAINYGYPNDLVYSYGGTSSSKKKKKTEEKTTETKSEEKPTESKVNYEEVTLDPKKKKAFKETKPESYTDLEYEKMKEYAKQIAEQKDLQLQREKDIVDKYLPIREQIAQSLLDGSYFNAETDPMAIEYRNEYTRGARKAMADTMANLSGRTGGLASSYAGAVAQNQYNALMDDLSGKILDLRTLAEQSARKNLNEYNNQESLNRSLQSANNGVISNNNAYTTSEYEAEKNRLQDAYNAYEHASQMGYGRFKDELADFYNKWNMYLQGRQQGEAERQFDEEMAYKYAALGASGGMGGRSGGITVGGGGGGGYSGGGGGGDTSSGGTQTLKGTVTTKEGQAAGYGSNRATGTGETIMNLGDERYKISDYTPTNATSFSQISDKAYDDKGNKKYTY